MSARNEARRAATQPISRRRPGAPRPAAHRRGVAESSGFARVGGLPLARLDAGDVVSHVFDALAQGFGGWLVTANVDFVQRSQIDAECAALYAEADLMVADGAPLVWASHLAGVPLPERVAGSDLVWLLAERAPASRAPGSRCLPKRTSSLPSSKR
jgi:UDP-N-acetyl-D-mannosaminuronic acid transferase (WecB/TagA/CpsF family)